MAAYAAPTASPREPNASGNAADSTRLAGTRASSSSRTAIRSGSSQFVTHVVYAHTSQTITSSSAVRAAPATLA